MLWLSVLSFAEFLGMCVCKQFQNYTLQCKNLRMLYLVEVLERIWFKPLILQMKKLKKDFPRIRNLFSLHYKSTRTNESMTLT